MTANQMITKLIHIEATGKHQPDTRRMMRDERFALTAACKSGDGRKIKDAMREARRVAKMWGVELT